MPIYGFTSATLDKKLALSRCKSSGDKNGVLYHIKWHADDALRGCYYLNNDLSSYSHEEEVLLLDGCRFYVAAVSNKLINGKDVTIISLTCNL